MFSLKVLKALREIVSFLFLLFVWVSADEDSPALARTGRHRRIVGGTPVDIRDFPYMVSLHYDNPDYHCGGSIISEEIVLTARHCLEEKVKYVRTGSSFFSKDGTTHNVVDKVTSIEADIAILKLDNPISFDDVHQPLILFNEDETITYGQIANVTGWGRLQETETTFPDELHGVSVPIVEQDTCKKTYEQIKKKRPTAREICAGYYGVGQKDACQGDSGGPLVIDNRQIGVVVHGRGCARPQYPGIYVSIPAMRAWIDLEISKLSAPKQVILIKN